MSMDYTHCGELLPLLFNAFNNPTNKAVDYISVLKWRVDINSDVFKKISKVSVLVLDEQIGKSKKVLINGEVEMRRQHMEIYITNGKIKKCFFLCEQPLRVYNTN